MKLFLAQKRRVDTFFTSQAANHGCTIKIKITHTMNPIFLTITKHTATAELCQMAHPNTIEAIGTLREMGKRGLRIIVRHGGMTWQVKRANNTEFCKKLDGVKKAAGIPFDHAEGERWLDDSARVIVWRAMWK